MSRLDNHYLTVERILKELKERKISIEFQILIMEKELKDTLKEIQDRNKKQWK